MLFRSGITAPEESVTVPDIVPVIVCALELKLASSENIKSNIAALKICLLIEIPVLRENGRTVNRSDIASSSIFLKLSETAIGNSGFG